MAGDGREVVGGARPPGVPQGLESLAWHHQLGWSQRKQESGAELRVPRHCFAVHRNALPSGCQAIWAGSGGSSVLTSPLFGNRTHAVG